MAYKKLTSGLVMLIVFHCGQVIGKNIRTDHFSKPALKCEVEGMNSIPGESVTFRCSVTPPTAVRYCEFRPPRGGSPILLEDGVTSLIGSDRGHKYDSELSIGHAKSGKATTESSSNSSEHRTVEVSSTTSQDIFLNRTKRSHRVRFYGWSTKLNYIGTGFANGDCSARINKVSLEDAGSWRCIVGVEEEVVEMAVKMNLLVHEGPSLPLTTHVQMSEDGTSAVLMCHTNNHRPLRFCRFLREDGIPLIGSPDDKEVGPGINLEAGISFGRYTYVGNGIFSGDCGVNITSLSENDAGEWTCVVGVVGEEGLQRGVLILKNITSYLLGGLSLGAILGIGLVCAFILFVIIHEIIERRVSWREKNIKKKRKEKITNDILNYNSNGKGKP